jgi:hypothetical protein
MVDNLRAPTRRLFFGCGLWFAVEFLAALIGAALAVLAIPANQPPWVMPVVFFGPPILVALLFAVFFLPRLLGDLREAARNAPSPESVAATGGSRTPSIGSMNGGASPSAGPPADSLPAVPTIATLPGLVLPHRLQRAELPFGCRFGCSVFAALFWNGIISIFVWRLIADWNRMGRFRWFQVAFLAPFVLVGIVLIIAVFATALRWFMSGLVGRIEVELAEHPVAPGRAIRIHVAQRGAMALKGVEARLICTEEASYLAGTTRSTATKEVARHLLFDPDQSPDGGRLPLEFEFTVPADSMHSFQAPNNKIKWTVRVEGRVLGLRFRDDFTLAVVPGESS